MKYPIGENFFFKSDKILPKWRNLSPMKIITNEILNYEVYISKCKNRIKYKTR